MLKYLLKRLVQMVVVLFTVSVIVFLVMSFTGDPVLMIVPPTATDAQIAEAVEIPLQFSYDDVPLKPARVFPDGAQR